ncbi:pentapeptide repeat-containing protein [Nostoc sp. HK-01]|uniref:Pentapeptide repeat-containing protein n=2 Tax=Nostocales TaxID=1161 RepID=A0A1Z4GDC4_9CYAN|nr:pentapeptide repeat-containing protein [Nostoc cycadae]BAY15514.1 pentapeptide repeat-containing protein [Anabaenopsis circularis NIES-21]BBD60363.1 pentapeptide repeat-containing protein [Nostoc sp. HK-01]GBE94833.1 pentapeptide repeat-containing protein [Nostoc cycadae WK-1]
MRERLRKWIQDFQEWIIFAVIFVLSIVVIRVFEDKPPFKSIVESLISSKFIGTLQDLSILAAVILYFRETPSRKKQAHYEAWRVINSAYGQRASGGRIQALQDLNDDGVSLAGLTADKAYLAGINLKGADLRDANLEGTNLKNACLQEIDLRNANLQQADLRYANLERANLRNANLQGQSTNLSYTNFQNAYLSHANFQLAYLWSANLQGADLSYANLQEADLSYANLQGANLKYANFQSADLSPTNLEKANFQGADLQNADLRDAQNLNPEQVKLARNWEHAKYDEALRMQLGLSPFSKNIEVLPPENPGQDDNLSDIQQSQLLDDF